MKDAFETLTGIFILACLLGSCGGCQGERGSQGSQGSQGYRGERGYTGPQGPQGPQGVQGSRGHKGEKGEQGQNGATGATGDPGRKGEDGTLPIAESIASVTVAFVVSYMVWLGGSHVRHRSARRPANETAKDKKLRRDISGLASALSWVIVIGLSVAALWIAVSTTGTSLPMAGMWATLAALQLSQIPICRGMAYSAIGSCHINMAAALGMILLTALTFALINDHLSSTSTTEARRASAIITRDRDQTAEVNSQVELLKKSIKRDVAAAEIIQTKRQQAMAQVERELNETLKQASAKHRAQLDDLQHEKAEVGKPGSAQRRLAQFEERKSKLLEERQVKTNSINSRLVAAQLQYAAKETSLLARIKELKNRQAQLMTERDRKLNDIKGFFTKRKRHDIMSACRKELESVNKMLRIPLVQLNETQARKFDTAPFEAELRSVDEECEAKLADIKRGESAMEEEVAAEKSQSLQREATIDGKIAVLVTAHQIETASIKKDSDKEKVQLDIYYEGKLAELLQSELSNQTLLSANEEMVRVLSQEIVEARASLNTGDGIYYRLADFFESAEKLPTNDGYMKVNILFFVVGLLIGIVNTALIYIAATIDLPNAVTTREEQ